MQTFRKTKMALAIGSALMVMAGAANAANGIPSFRSPVASASLITTVAGGTSDANIKQMLTAGGLVDEALTLDIALDSGAGAAADGNNSEAASAVDGTIGVASAGPTLTIGDATATNNHIIVYTGTGADIASVPLTGATALLGATVDGIVHISVALPAPGATAGYRITAGVLEYSSNVTIAAPVWSTVKIDVRSVSGKEIYSEADATAGFIAANDFELTTTGIVASSVGTSLAPAPIVKTKGSPTDASPLINGFIVDTLVPIDVFTIATNFAVSPRDPGGLITAVNAATPFSSSAITINTTAFAAASAVGALGTAVVAPATDPTQPSKFENTVTFTAAADWTTGGAADDAIFAASPIAFNTGVEDEELPVTLGNGTTKPKYTQVFDVATGTGKELTDMPSTTSGVIDNTAPVIVASGISFTTTSSQDPGYKDSESNLSIVFSESMSAIGQDDIRELLENTSAGNDTLAVLSMNSGVIPYFTGVTTPTDGITNSQVTIKGLLSTDIADFTAGTWAGKSITVTSGITVQETNDTDYAANLLTGDILDIESGTGANGEELAGGIRSASGVIEAITNATQTATTSKPGIAWGEDTSAKASASSAAEQNKIDTITVTFAAGKEVALASGKDSTMLAKNLVVDVFGSAKEISLDSISSNTASTLVNVSSTQGLQPGMALYNFDDGYLGEIDTIVSGTIVELQGNALATNVSSGAAYASPIRFQVRPESAALSTDGKTITIKVPTAFIYEKLAGLTVRSAWVSYVVDNKNTGNGVMAESSNNVLVGKADSTVLVAQGLTGNNYGWDDLDLINAGAEPVVLPLVFTADQTGNQSTLLTQSVQTTIAGSSAGSLVEAYLAYWIETPTSDSIGVDVLGGSISKGNDKIQTGLAIEFADQGSLEGAIKAELELAAPAQKAIAGVQLASKAVAAKDIPVYVKLVRSNDTTGLGNDPGGNTQSYINARAILAYDMGEFGHDGTNDDLSPIYACTLNPNTGAIKGSITGKLDIKTNVASGSRGLHFLDINGEPTDNPNAAIIGSSIVAQPSADGLALPGTANLNLLMGIDPSTTTMANLGGMDPFVLLVHRDNDEGKYTLLTSADSNAVNYMPFAPDLNNTKTDKGAVSRADVKLSVTDVKAFTLPASPNWALYGLGDPATNPKALGSDKSLPRMLVGLYDGTPYSFWTNDETTDMAMMIAGNKVGVATELNSDINDHGDTTGTGQTLSSISANNAVAGSVGLAWSNVNYAYQAKIFVAQNTGVFAPDKPVSSTVPAGWSLMTVPTTATFSSNVDAIIKVGAQVGMDSNSDILEGSGAGIGQFSWFAEDGALPSGQLTAGDAVFVHAIKAEKQ